ncbi:MAG: mechanosensitive ion channel family protein [Haloferacaceae archaeon]
MELPASWRWTYDAARTLTDDSMPVTVTPALATAGVVAQTGGLLPPGTVQTLRSILGSNPARVAIAIVIVAVGVVLSKYVVRLIGRPVARRFERESLAQIVLRLIRLGVIGLAAGAAADVVGFGAGDILLSVTVFSAVLGIVLAPIVGNLISGLFVLADQPYEIGDMVELEDGTRGFVDDITIRYTKVFTLDNTFLVIPNSTIREQRVTNYSAEDQRTRLALPVLVTYEGDLDAARRLLERAARECEEVIEGGPDIRIGAARYPAGPTAYLDEYADSGVLITLRYWARQPFKLLTVRSKVQSRFWELITEDGVDVEIAYPHQQLRVDESDPLTVRMTGAGDGEAVRVPNGASTSEYGSDREAATGTDPETGTDPR